MQWFSISGLENYDEHVLTEEATKRWAAFDIKVFYSTAKKDIGKYNVKDINLSVDGGEYANQDDFGWTNGVLLKLQYL